MFGATSLKCLYPGSTKRAKEGKREWKDKKRRETMDDRRSTVRERKDDRGNTIRERIGDKENITNRGYKECWKTEKMEWEKEI